MKNGKQIMTVVYIPFANPPVLIFCYHIKACQYPDILFPLSYPPNDVRTSVLYLSAFSSPSLHPYRNRTTWLENRAGFLKNKGLVSSSGAKHIEENDSVNFCLAKVKFSFLL